MVCEELSIMCQINEMDVDVTEKLMWKVLDVASNGKLLLYSGSPFYDGFSINISIKLPCNVRENSQTTHLK
jgi:hypothetical protein